MKFIPAGLLVVLFFSACQRERKAIPDITPSDITTTKSDSSPPSDSGDEVVRGLFVVGKNMLSFLSCTDPDLDYAVVDSTHQMKELYKKVFLHSPAFPYEYVYVEVKGEVVEPDATHSARGFSHVLVVNEVLTFEPKNHLNSCIPYDFWAMGNNWALQVSAKEGVMVLKDYSAMKVYVFEYFPPKAMGNESYTYASNNYAMQASIKAVIKMQDCDDSENSFEYSASVLLNGKRYSGCAVRGTK